MKKIMNHVAEANNSNLPAAQFENTNSQATQSSRNMKVKVGPVSTSYEGDNPKKDMTDFLIPVGIFIGVLGGSYIAYKLLNANKKHDHKTEELNTKSENKIRESQAYSKGKMDEYVNKTDNDIRLEQALSEIRIKERQQMVQFSKATTAPCSPKQGMTLASWIKGFHSKHPLPDYSAIQFLASILDRCPAGYEDAVLLSLVTECGALCFPKVRALYLDGNEHSPSLQTIVEGKQGSGKGKLLELHKCLFNRLIESDMRKLNLENGSDVIIQTAGINISQSKFHEVMANNQGVHIYAIETEINTVKEAFKKSNGLSLDYLRKAFYNEPIYLNNKAKGTVHGSFPVFFNYTFTGTPKAIDSLINASEVENGTASRICFSAIPEVERFAPSMEFPSGSELQSMQDQIDEWRGKYCYWTMDEKDIACAERIIIIDYVCDALQEWLAEQYDLYLTEGINERNDNRPRIATIAFHCAIVLHMLAGEPKPSDRKLRKTVKELTIYIANYCMERYLYKFSNAPLPQLQADIEMSNAANDRPRRRLTDDEMLEWFPKRGTFDGEGREIGLGYISRELNVHRDSVRNAYTRYKKKHLQP